MKGRKIAAIVLSTAIIVSGMGTIAMAEESAGVQQEIQTVQKASDSNAEKNQDANREEEKQEVNQDTNKKEEKASPSDAVYVSTEEQLREAVKHDGEIILEQEIPLTEPLYISGNISMEGEGITFAGDRETCKWRSMIMVGDGAKVILHNITIDGTGFECNEKFGDHWKDYYVLKTLSGTEITLEDGAEIIANDTTLSNPRKGGMWISGTCYMKGGTVSGFAFGGSSAGIKVGGKFEMTGGLLTQNWHGLAIIGEFPDEDIKKGHANVSGGAITDNVNGVFNSGDFVMNGGRITGNETGVFNNNYDALADQKFSPIAKLAGGEITDNGTGVYNKDGGTVTIGGTSEINGQWIDESLFRSMASRTDVQSNAVIQNENQSILNIEGGTITVNASEEAAIFNDSTSKFTMTGGEIVAAGENSIAIQNTNTKVGDVVIDRGTLTTTGTGSKLLDNQGYINLNGDKVELGGDASGKYLILASHNEGGNVTPSSVIAEGGQEVELIITPDEGYRISTVTVDDKLNDIVSPLKLPVTANHRIVVTFEKKQSSSSGSSGGSSSGSSRSATVSSTKTIPETPGSWIQDQTGWKFINESVSYSNTWIRKNNAWYWLGEDGYMKTGWNLISEKWYYLVPVSGEMKTGWIADGGNWYYADEAGARVTGWVKTGEKWYYLNADGKMAVNTTTPDGYKVDENGVMIG